MDRTPQEMDAIDGKMGFVRYEAGPAKIGWLVNMHAALIPSDEHLQGFSGVDFYFLDEEGGSFKATLLQDPYFFIMCEPGSEPEVEEVLRKKLERGVKSISRTSKEDLSIPNHLIGIKRPLIQISFHSMSQLFDAKRILLPIVKNNQSRKQSRDIYASTTRDPLEMIYDIREHDVPYHARVCIDQNIRVGKWYRVEPVDGGVKISPDERIAFADPVVLAFDIETTKQPLKFPDASADQVMMISYMIDGEGFLITNREIVSADIDDFEYTPKPEYPGMFTIFNEDDERGLLMRFFSHVQEAKPTVIATFNGDFFDWPFVEKRALINGLDMYDEIGFAVDGEGEYKSRYCSHMDCFRWVKRDSYLPQGSQGLKAVTQAKLGYNPIELDPELMTPYAFEKPQILSEYSVSDAVATFYLYSKYVHPFIFSLCSIIPLNPDEVLRKGTGTLCEMLLTVQAHESDILLPNKHTDPLERFYNGHLLESETYVGGHVESLEAGVFRHDLPCKFKVDPQTVQQLVDELDAALKFSITVEEKKSLEDVTNYNEVFQQVKRELIHLKENPHRDEVPLIYHVDVASMYPNIMTTNRLQPDSIKSEKDCAACDFNRPGKTCDRRLPWSWRGEFLPAKMDEYNMIRKALLNESFANNYGIKKPFGDLSHSEQAAHIRKRLSEYSRKVYHRLRATETVQREAIVCQRENPFYVNTVRAFRDRRYEFKGLAKDWKIKTGKASDKFAKDEARKMTILYDSLQLAHKVILNSFYGYVMRKGSRWYSMEMAGITCLTGATIIQMARALVDKLGRPLELDTDGIWCILPKSFPEEFEFKLRNGKSLTVSYPCSMLNYRVHQKFTNHQYQEIVDPTRQKYRTISDNSIFFEVDGPYRAMVMPTSKEEGKGLKKRYAVFNFDGSLAELKGFELKRRGELQLVKNFQSDIFKLFLQGETLEECYQAVASVANRWLDVLDTRGEMLEDEDLIELICENRSMSKTLAEYGNQKSTSITTAKRLGEFLGEEMVKDTGLACKYIICEKPLDAPITERAVPVAIFSADLDVKRTFLRRWLVDPSLEDLDPRKLLDWDYYKGRLASVVQKIITIPAALQNVPNPVPRVLHPDWLQKVVAAKNDKRKQSSLSKFLTVGDIEGESTKKQPRVVSRKRKLEAQEEQIVLPACPDPTKDYVAFLQHQKVKWFLSKKTNQRTKHLFGAKKSLHVGNHSAESLAKSFWQVLEYIEEPSGSVKVFAVVKDKLHTFTFHIPKKVYVTFKDATSAPATQSIEEIIPGSRVEKANSTLPSGEKPDLLYKITMPQQTHEWFSDPNIKDVYESRVGRAHRAIIELGSCVDLNQSKVGTLGKGLDRGFELRDLRKTHQEKYLYRFKMPVVYLLHVVSNGYEIFSLFKSYDTTAFIFVVKPSPAAADMPSNMEKLFHESYESKKEKLGHLIDYPDNLDFEVVSSHERTKVCKKLEKQCNSVSGESPGKPLFVVQSPDCGAIVSQIRAISEFPKLTLTLNEIKVPALQWQTLVLKRIFNHILSLGLLLAHAISQSRFANVPLCNAGVGETSRLIDLIYARHLYEADIVLWWSPTLKPDIALRSTSLDFGFPTVNDAGAFENVCLEIQVTNLNVNTILTSALINEAEGSDLAGMESNSESGTRAFAEDAFSQDALNVLRNLVRKWWDEAMGQSRHAETLVQGLVVWVQSSRSFLYDPQLHYHVHNLTKKSFLQLLGEFRKMGSHIVSASQNKIIVKTGKTAVENSYAYGNYIVKSIRSKPLFNYVEMRVSKYWDCLIWMDRYNYIGRGCEEISASDEQDLQVESHWLISEYLPEMLASEFHDWVVLFLDNLVKEKDGVTQTQYFASRIEEKEVSATEASILTTLKGPLTKRVKQLIQLRTQSVINPSSTLDFTFPKRAGSHLEMENPVLELVKSLCAVFMLSKKLNIQVRMLKRELLKLFEIKEFSKSASFQDPSASLVLDSVVCESCNYTKDIDFCKDAQDEIFACQNCQKAFNKVSFEEKLVALLQKWIYDFYSQDLRCERCSSIKKDEFREYCACSGKWVGTVSGEDVTARVRVMENVAAFYDLGMLRGAIE